MPVPAPNPSGLMAVSPKVDLPSTVAGRSAAAICCGVMTEGPAGVAVSAGTVLVGGAAGSVGAVVGAAVGCGTGVGAAGASPQAANAIVSITAHTST